MNEDYESLEKVLIHERIARKKSERILTEQSKDLYESRAELLKIQNKLELALWASNESIWEWFLDTDKIMIRRYNRGTDTAYEETQTLDEFWAKIHPNDYENYRLQWLRHLDGDAEFVDITFRVKAGEGYRWLRLRGRTVELDENKEPLRILGTSKDVTDIRKAERSSRLIASAFSSSRDAMLILQKNKQIMEANSAFFTLINEENHSTDIDLSQYIKLTERKISNLKLHERMSEESEVVRADRSAIPVEITYSKFEFEDGEKDYIVAIVRDITERKKAENQLNRMAMYDPLTNLHNRNAFQNKLDELQDEISEFSVLFIDLDGFKAVNDTMTHEIGDELLIAVSKLLRSSQFGNSIAARWGGDEFLLAIRTCEKSKIIEYSRQVINGIKNIGDKLSLPVRVSASIGIASYPENATDNQALIRAADAAMYGAKALGKSAYVFYDLNVEQQAQQKISLLAELKKAIDTQSLDFHLQGQFDRTETPVCAEILCRWQSPIHGHVTPSVFIPLAEENGLAFALGNIAIDAAIDFLTLLKSYGYNFRIAVNISPLHLMHPDFLMIIANKIKNAQVNPTQLELEVTESSFIGDAIRASEVINNLRSMGFKVAMDDFGTGYSSFSYMRQIDFDIIKIDRSFVIDLESDQKADLLLRGIINICNDLGVETVAEGIETEAQMMLLKDMGVTNFQGFFLGRPMPISEFVYSLKNSD